MSCHYEGIRSFKDDVRPVIGGLGVDGFDRQTVLALYPAQDALNTLIDKDRRRFEQAIQKTGAAPAVSAANEQIAALSRRYAAELTVAEAASEAGLEVPEFLVRLTASPRLVSLGFGQLAVSSGGIKRDAWEKQFGDLVRELRLGDYLSRGVLGSPSINSLLQAGLLSLKQQRLALSPTLSPSQTADRPAEALRTAQSIHIMSRTGYFNPSELAAELLKKPDFARLNIAIVNNAAGADLVIEVDRLVFTTHFPYVVVDKKNNAIVASGEVNSLFGTVPAKIAKAFTKQLQAARAQ
jgi:hypothetical protein